MGRVDVAELKRRRWPLPPFPVDPEIRNEDRRLTYSNLPKPDGYETSARVSKGSVTAYALWRRGDPEAIQPGESAITSLALGADGRVFGATSGRRSHLFTLGPHVGEVHSLKVIGEGCGVSRSLVVTSDGLILGGTREKSGRIFRYDPRSPHGEIETVAVPVDEEGIVQLTIDRRSETIYGITAPSGVFFAFDLASGEALFREQIDEAGIFSEALAVDRHNVVWGAGRWGRLFRYRRDDERLEHLDLRIPFMPGREMYTGVDALAVSEDEGCVYGGEAADGVLFRLDPGSMEIICLGKPISQPCVRCLVVGKDGCVFGVGGRPDGMCRLFRYDPRTRDLRDLGVLFTMEPRHWHGYEFDCMLAGPEGEIYLGERDRMSHLFVYRPYQER